MRGRSAESLTSGIELGLQEVAFVQEENKRDLFEDLIPAQLNP